MASLFPRGIEIVGSAIIENAEGKILLVQSPKWHDKWTMPGGHIEPGESILASQVRETKEEVGLDVIPEGIIAYGELIGSKDFARPAHFIYFDILCTTDATSVQLDGKELKKYAWVDPAEALTWDLAESYAETIQQYVAYRQQHPRT